MKIRNANAAVTLSALVLTASAHAGITGVTGATTWLALPPASCVPGALSGITAYAWDEQQNTPLTLIADMVNNPGNSGAPIPGPITGNFDSHFIHFEQVAGTVPANGTVTFNNPIVAVLFRPISLDSTDVSAGAGSTTYPTFYPFRGIAGNSFFSILGNTLTFNLTTANPVINVAQIRVLTQVPAPATAGLLGMGALALGRRRRR
jgi:hypothetical protein